MSGANYQFLPADAATTAINTLTSVISANIGVILTLIVFTGGVAWAMRKFSRSAKLRQRSAGRCLAVYRKKINLD